jgi:hypothetical protein
MLKAGYRQSHKSQLFHSLNGCWAIIESVMCDVPGDTYLPRNFPSAPQLLSHKKLGEEQTGDSVEQQRAFTNII